MDERSDRLSKARSFRVKTNKILADKQGARVSDKKIAERERETR